MPKLFEKCFKHRTALRAIETQLNADIFRAGLGLTWQERRNIGLDYYRNTYSYGYRSIPRLGTKATNADEASQLINQSIERAKAGLIEIFGCIPDRVVFDISGKHNGFVMQYRFLGLYGDTPWEDIPYIVIPWEGHYVMLGILAPPVQYVRQGARL